MSIEHTTAETTYALEAVRKIDGDRLREQYSLFQACLDRNSPIPPSIDIGLLGNVLDAAAGPLVWSLDVASQPALQEQLASNQIKLYACDMSPALFPSADVLDRHKITAFVQDITKPFPREMLSKFDLINMRLLVLGLSKDGWVEALRNIWELLKPGGKLLLVEGNAVWHHPDRRNPGSDEDATYKFIDELNTTMDRTYADKKGYISDPPKHIAKLVSAANFKIESQNVVGVPFGPLTKRWTGSFAEIILAEEEFLISSYVGVQKAMMLSSLANGQLEGPNGPITMKEDVERLMASVEEGYREVGAIMDIIEIIATKLVSSLP